MFKLNRMTGDTAGLEETYEPRQMPAPSWLLNGSFHGDRGGGSVRTGDEMEAGGRVQSGQFYGTGGRKA